MCATESLIGWGKASLPAVLSGLSLTLYIPSRTNTAGDASNDSKELAPWCLVELQVVLLGKQDEEKHLWQRAYQPPHLQTSTTRETKSTLVCLPNTRSVMKHSSSFQVALSPGARTRGYISDFIGPFYTILGYLSLSLVHEVLQALLVALCISTI